MLPRTLTELRSSSFGQDSYRNRTIKDEMRINLMRKLEAKDPIFTGIVGYEETVVPQVVNAILSRHNMILLGLRGQAKSRILRGLVEFLDDVVPVIEGCDDGNRFRRHAGEGVQQRHRIPTAGHRQHQGPSGAARDSTHRRLNPACLPVKSGSAYRHGLR